MVYWPLILPTNPPNSNLLILGLPLPEIICNIYCRCAYYQEEDSLQVSSEDEGGEGGKAKGFLAKPTNRQIKLVPKQKKIAASKLFGKHNASSDLHLHNNHTRPVETLNEYDCKTHPWFFVGQVLRACLSDRLHCTSLEAVNLIYVIVVAKRKPSVHHSSSLSLSRTFFSFFAQKMMVTTTGMLSVVQLLHILAGVLSHPAGPLTRVKRHVGVDVSHEGIYGGHWLGRRSMSTRILEAATEEGQSFLLFPHCFQTATLGLTLPPPRLKTVSLHYTHIMISLIIPASLASAECHSSFPLISPHHAAPSVKLLTSSWFPLHSIRHGKCSWHAGSKGNTGEKNMISVQEDPEKMPTTRKEAASEDGSQKPNLHGIERTHEEGKTAEPTPGKGKWADGWRNRLQRVNTALRNLYQRIKQSLARLIKRVFARKRADKPPSDVKLVEFEKAKAAAPQSPEPLNKAQDPPLVGPPHPAEIHPQSDPVDQHLLAHSPALETLASSPEKPADIPATTDHVNVHGHQDIGDGRTSTLLHQHNNAQQTLVNFDLPEQPKEHPQVQLGGASEKSAAGEVSQLSIPYFTDLPQNRKKEEKKVPSAVSSVEGSHDNFFLQHEKPSGERHDTNVAADKLFHLYEIDLESNFDRYLPISFLFFPVSTKANQEALELAGDKRNPQNRVSLKCVDGIRQKHLWNQQLSQRRPAINIHTTITTWIMSLKELLWRRSTTQKDIQTDQLIYADYCLGNLDLPPYHPNKSRQGIKCGKQIFFTSLFINVYKHESFIFERYPFTCSTNLSTLRFAAVAVVPLFSFCSFIAGLLMFLSFTSAFFLNPSQFMLMLAPLLLCLVGSTPLASCSPVLCLLSSFLICSALHAAVCILFLKPNQECSIPSTSRKMVYRKPPISLPSLIDSNKLNSYAHSLNPLSSAQLSNFSLSPCSLITVTCTAAICLSPFFLSSSYLLFIFIFLSMLPCFYFQSLFLSIHYFLLIHCLLCSSQSGVSLSEIKPSFFTVQSSYLLPINIRILFILLLVFFLVDSKFDGVSPDNLCDNVFLLHLTQDYPLGISKQASKEGFLIFCSKFYCHIFSNILFKILLHNFSQVTKLENSTSSSCFSLVLPFEIQTGNFHNMLCLTRDPEGKRSVFRRMQTLCFTIGYIHHGAFQKFNFQLNCVWKRAAWPDQVVMEARICLMKMENWVGGGKSPPQGGKLSLLACYYVQPSQHSMYSGFTEFNCGLENTCNTIKFQITLVLNPLIIIEFFEQKQNFKIRIRKIWGKQRKKVKYGVLLLLLCILQLLAPCIILLRQQEFRCSGLAQLSPYDVRLLGGQFNRTLSLSHCPVSLKHRGRSPIASKVKETTSELGHNWIQ
ncbi:hypothetical protein VP01_32g13 [Puccinia sorghi]|uniref:Uncharacterized protein n=1 Tax=Puccinia sorghi TaxID=27349 RepID=A0A0L6UYA9_9BASI|nr:hypothetical protein VP01_32g13 [Puccinia sorghi]